MPKSSSYWLVKQEPEKYSWDDFLKDKKTYWDGVRNYQARNNLRAMKKGDQVLFYRSVVEPAVVGICEVVKEHYPDHTAKDGDWSMVDLKVMKTLKREISLAEIKKQKSLAEIALIKQSRLSVMPVTAGEFKTIVRLSEK